MVPFSMPPGRHLSTLATLNWPSKRVTLIHEISEKPYRKTNTLLMIKLTLASCGLVISNLAAGYLRGNHTQTVCLEGPPSSQHMQPHEDIVLWTHARDQKCCQRTTSTYTYTDTVIIMQIHYHLLLYPLSALKVSISIILSCSGLSEDTVWKAHRAAGSFTNAAERSGLSQAKRRHKSTGGNKAQTASDAQHLFNFGLNSFRLSISLHQNITEWHLLYR